MPVPRAVLIDDRSTMKQLIVSDTNCTRTGTTKASTKYFVNADSAPVVHALFE